MANEAVETTETVETESTEVVQETTEETVPTTQSIDDLPEWAQKELKRARDEAAKYRQKSKSAVDELRTSLTEEFGKRESELVEARENSLMKAAESEHELMRLRVALNAGISSEKASAFAERLHGESEDELKEDAQRLMDVFGPSEPKYDRSQGSGSHLPLNGDPILEAFQRRLGI